MIGVWAVTGGASLVTGVAGVGASSSLAATFATLDVALSSMTATREPVSTVSPSSARICTRTPAAGEGISYGHRQRTSRETTIATVPLGYADGIPRNATNVGPLAHAGRPHTIAGRVCMDQFVVDLGPYSEAREGDEVDRRIPVDGPALRFRAAVGGCRELSLGESVDAVIFDDIDHVDAAPHAMGKLAEPDRGRVAVPRDAEINEIAIGEVGAGQNRRHAPVNTVEAVRMAEEISGRFR